MKAEEKIFDVKKVKVGCANRCPVLRLR